MAVSRDFTLASGTYAATTNETSLDIDRMYSGVFYLNVTSCSGGADTVDVKIQDSPDNSTWYDIVTFTQANAATTERKVTTNLGRYMRAVVTMGAGATAVLTLKAHLNEA